MKSLIQITCLGLTLYFILTSTSIFNKQPFTSIYPKPLAQANTPANIPYHIRNYKLGVGYMLGSRSSSMDINEAYTKIAQTAEYTLVARNWQDWLAGDVSQEIALARSKGLQILICI